MSSSKIGLSKLPKRDISAQRSLLSYCIKKTRSNKSEEKSKDDEEILNISECQSKNVVLNTSTSVHDSFVCKSIQNIVDDNVQENPEICIYVDVNKIGNFISNLNVGNYKKCLH